MNQINIGQNRQGAHERENTMQSEILSTENSESSLNPVVTIKSVPFTMIDEI